MIQYLPIGLRHTKVAKLQQKVNRVQPKPYLSLVAQSYGEALILPHVVLSGGVMKEDYGYDILLLHYVLLIIFWYQQL